MLAPYEHRLTGNSITVYLPPCTDEQIENVIKDIKQGKTLYIEGEQANRISLDAELFALGGVNLVITGLVFRTEGGTVILKPQNIFDTVAKTKTPIVY